MAYEIEQSGITNLLGNTNFSATVQSVILSSLDKIVEVSAASTVPSTTQIAVVSSDGEITNIPDTVSVVIFQGSNIVFDGAGDTDRVISAINGDNVITLTGTGKIVVTTGDGSDKISTGIAGDTIALGGGNDTVDSGGGVDVVRITEKWDDVTVTVAADGSLVVTTNAAEAQSASKAAVGAGTDAKLISNAEVIEFADGSIFVAAQDNNDGTVARIYEVAFGRKLDIEGFRYWMEAENAGMSLGEIGNRFVDSAEYNALYGGMTDAQFIDAVYQNLFHRSADSVGSAFWEDKLSSPDFTRGEMLAAFAYSQEAQDTKFDHTVIMIVGSQGGGST